MDFSKLLGSNTRATGGTAGKLALAMDLGKFLSVHAIAKQRSGQRNTGGAQGWPPGDARSSRPIALPISQ